MQSITPNILSAWFKHLRLPLFILTVALLGYGLNLALINSPADYQQGETVRIMYIHVPSAWLALGLYTALSFSSIAYLIWRNPLSFLFAQSVAPLGACFAFITLVTGAIWGKPIWGTWWVWDARLTSMLILFIVYMGYISLSQAFDREDRNASTSSILAIVGLINIPIIKFSVEWWNTLHQPASIWRGEGPSIHPDMLTPLIIMFAGLSLLSLLLISLRMQARMLEKKIDRLQQKIANN